MNSKHARSIEKETVMSERAFGFASAGIEHVKGVIERALGQEFRAHESLYRGGPCYRLEGVDYELILQRNWDLLDDSRAEPTAPDAELLLYLSEEGEDTPISKRLELLPEIMNIERS